MLFGAEIRPEENNQVTFIVTNGTIPQTIFKNLAYSLEEWVTFNYIEQKWYYSIIF